MSGIEGYLNEHFPSYLNLLIIKNGYLVYESRNKSPKESLSSSILKNTVSIILHLLKKSNETFIDEHGECYNLRSVTKSIISLLLGIALDKQYISGIDEKIYQYFPEHNFKNDIIKKEITIEHLVTMKSGLPSIEKGRNALKFLFSDGNWVNYILDLPLECKPGESLYIILQMHIFYLQLYLLLRK